MLAAGDQFLCHHLSTLNSKTAIKSAVQSELATFNCLSSIFLTYFLKRTGPATDFQ